MDRRVGGLVRSLGSVTGVGAGAGVGRKWMGGREERDIKSEGAHRANKDGAAHLVIRSGLPETGERRGKSGRRG